MLQMRARGFCARDGVPDVLHGLYLREESEEEPHRSAAQDKAPGRNAEDLLPPPAPEDESETPVASAKGAEALAPQLEAETVRDPDDFLSDLDVSLAACKTEDQLEEVWAENLETVSYLGMQPRQKAELIYDRHKFRITAGMDVLNAAENPLWAAP